MTTIKIFRWKAAPLAVALLLSAHPAAFAQQGQPNALQGFSRNKNEPVRIEATKLEVHDKEKLAIFTGNVFVQQGDTTLRSPELRVYYEGDDKKAGSKPKPKDDTSGGDAAVKSANGKVSKTENNMQQKIKRIEALGGVIVTSKEQRATGNRADFLMKENTVTLTGNVVVSQGQNVMRGDKLIVDLTSSNAHMEAGTKDKPGRVQGLFVSSDKEEKDKKDGAAKSESKKRKTPQNPAPDLTQ